MSDKIGQKRIDPLEEDSELSLEDALSIVYDKEGAINKAEYKRLRLELYYLRCCKEAQNKEDERLRKLAFSRNDFNFRHSNDCLCVDCRAMD